ncbi:hypothetical protein ID86_27435 [Salmonella enterica subsp. enterica]|nr:hypothetical protein [Salmonella enterica subsp. enterica serovar Redlands]
MTTNNHPANGPVSLDRLHQISEILSKAAAQSDGGNLGYAMADAVKVIDGAIASFGAEPVLYAMQGVKLDTDAISTCKNVVDGWVDEWNQERKPGVPEYKTVPLYTTPPAPVVPDGLRQALSNAGIAAPESDEMLAATCEKYIQMLVTWVKDRKPFQPVPVVPEEITDESTEQRLMGRRWAHSFCAGWNACRAAMLSGGKS